MLLSLILLFLLINITMVMITMSIDVIDLVKFDNPLLESRYLFNLFTPFSFFVSIVVLVFFDIYKDKREFYNYFEKEGYVNGNI